MKNPKKESAKRKAMRRLKNMYPNDFQKLYKQELNIVDLKIDITTDKVESIITKDKVESIIAKSLMNTRYLSALMQDVGGKR